MNVLRTLGDELFAISQETSILKAKRYASGCGGLAAAATLYNEETRDGGWQTARRHPGFLATPFWRGSCWVQGICGSLRVQRRSPKAWGLILCPQNLKGVPRSLPLSLPLGATVPHPESKGGFLKHKSVSSLSCSEAFRGKSRLTSEAPDHGQSALLT